VPSVDGLGTDRIVVLVWSDRHDARVDRVVLDDGGLRVEVTRELPGDGCSSTAEVTAWTTVAAVEVAMDLTAVIEIRPGVRSGRPCFVGTCIAVYDVLEYLAAGMTTEEIVDDLPELTPEHVRAAMEFAALRERRLATA
jgi:uncharacterized protein (DUF433 family)